MVNKHPRRSRKKRKQRSAQPTSSPPARRTSDHVVERPSEDSPNTPRVGSVEGVAEHLQIAHRFEFSSGPLPQPETFGGYEAIVSGAADRIITMAENQLRHHQAQESARLNSDITLESRGQWMAFVVALIALAGGMGLLAF